MSELVLYNYYRSSTSYRVRIALKLKNIPYEYKAIHLLNNGGEQHLKEYRNINPIGGVPAIQHQGHTVAQSRAIIEYIDALHPEPPLIPKDVYKRALASQICDNINCEIHPLTNLRVMLFLENKFGATPDQKQNWIHHWNKECLLACEKLLQNISGPYCLGNQVSIADLFLIPHLYTANRYGVDLRPYPTLMRINEECLKLEPFQAAHPAVQPDTPPEMKL